MNILNRIPKFIFALVGLFLISGCSTIKSYFPDKEKEYITSVEIPELVIPPDLSSEIFNKDQAVTSNTPTINGTKELENKVNKPARPKPKPKPEKVRLLSYAGGASRLQIDEPFVRAWRIVGKSLTRKSLEIIDRNIENGLFLIQYEPNEKDIEDGSFWDELVFLFGDDQSNEQEYQVRLVENADRTEVLVLDQEGLPLSQGIGLNLLNLMHETIKADFAEQQ